MYLLRRLGIPLAALLVLSVLALITVVLLFEQNGILLPYYGQEKYEEVTTVPVAEEITENNLEYYYPTKGETIK